MDTPTLINNKPLDMAAIAPYPLEKISRNEAGLMNIVFTRGRCLVTNSEHEKFEISFKPALSGYFPETGIGLKIATGPGRCCLGMEDFIFNDITDRFFNGHAILDLSAPIRPVIIEAVFEALLDRFESLGGRKCAIEQANFGQSVTDPVCRHRLYFKLIRHQDKGSTRGHLDLDTPSLKLLSGLLERFGQPRDAAGCWDALPQTLVFEIGHLRMPQEILAGVRPLDIILPKSGFSGKNRRIRVRLPDGRFFKGEMDMENNSIILTEKGGKAMSELQDQDQARIENQEIPGMEDAAGFEPGPEQDPDSVQDPELEQKMVREDREHGAGLDQADTIDTDAFPVSLVFELGQKQFSLGELKKIGPGYHIQLDQEVETPVIVRANGKIIGTGQMLQIGERLGIRILRISNNAAR